MFFAFVFGKEDRRKNIKQNFYFFMMSHQRQRETASYADVTLKRNSGHEKSSLSEYQSHCSATLVSKRVLYLCHLRAVKYQACLTRNGV